jgi:Leucine-rich repeat (LRR) protein
LSYFDNLTNLSLTQLPNLQSVDFSYTPQLTNLSFAQLPSMRSLSLRLLDKLTDLSSLAHAAPALTKLSIGTNASDLTPLADLTQLKQLSLHGDSFSDLSPLSNLTGLKLLSIGWNQITDISPLGKLTNLKHLGISSQAVTDIQGLTALKKLESLSLETNVTDLSPAGELPNLRLLSAVYGKVEKTTGLATAKNLRQLYLSGNQIEDISSLASLKHMIYLDISGNQIQDISPVLNLPKLKHLDFSNNQVALITGSEVVQGIEKLRKKHVDVNTTDQNAGPLLAISSGGEEITDFTWEPLDFGTKTDGTPLERAFRLRNKGTTPVQFSKVRLPQGYQLVDGFPNQLDPQSEATITVRYTGTAPGTFYGKLTFDTNNALERHSGIPMVASVAGPNGVPEPQPLGLFRGTSTRVEEFPPGATPIISHPKFSIEIIGWTSGAKPKAVVKIQGVDKATYSRHGNTFGRELRATDHIFFEAKLFGDTLVGTYTLNHRIYHSTFELHRAES